MLLAALIVTSSALAQSGFDRLGGDYQQFEIRNGDPAVCAARCERDSRCRAWSFSYPRTENALAVCWLKNKVPPRNENKCCVSGVRGAGVIAPRKGQIEFGIDRFGGDYREFERRPIRSAPPAVPPAKATTNAAPGPMCGPAISAPPARCYLKDKITRPRRKPCCISGVVR